MNNIPLTKIQKLISARMLQSKRTKPSFYLESKADITELMAIRPRLKKKLGVKITTNSFFVRAIAIAARKYPAMIGAACENNDVTDCINVGFAVNAPQGLVVPVIKNADQKTLAEIATEEAALTEKARSNELTLDQVEGETIALSNLGAYGIDSFLGIVPPTANTILAVGNADNEVVCENGEIAARKIASMSLATDSQIISEVYAAQFLNFIVEQLRQPQQLT